MANKARAKGTTKETAVLGYILPSFPSAHRLPISSALGDLGGLPIVCEVKNHAAMTLADWMNQAEKSSVLAGKPAFVVHHRKGRGVAETYVTCSLKTIVPFWLAYERERLDPDDSV